MSEKESSHRVYKQLCEYLESGHMELGGYTLGLAKIAEVVPDSDVTDVDFTSLDVNTHKFYLLFFNVQNATSTGHEIYFMVNGDTTIGNYYHQKTVSDNTAISGARANNPMIIWQDASDYNTGFALIMRTMGNVIHVISHSIRKIGSNLISMRIDVTNNQTTTNITSIKLRANTTNGIKTGSRFVLYGVIE